MNELVVKLRILARAEATLFKADARRRTNHALLAATSIGCIFVGLVFVNIGLFFWLSDADIDARAAFILAGANIALALIPFAMRRQSKPGPEEQMVREIREMAADEVSKDLNTISDEIAALGAVAKNLKSGVSSLGSGGSLSALGPLLPLVIDLIKRSRK